MALAVAVVLSAIRLHSIYHRNQMHADEVFSVALAGHNAAYVEALPADTVLTGLEIKSMLENTHSMKADLKALHRGNYDNPHASAYYMLLRLALQGVREFDVRSICIRAGWLNMLFFWITVWATWRLGMLLWHGRRHRLWLSVMLLCVAFATSASVNCTIMAREYQMAQMFLMLFTVTAIGMGRLFRAGREPSLRLWGALILTIAGCASTGYLNSWFVVPVLLLVCVRTRRQIRARTFCAMAGAGIIALGLSWLAYTGFFNFITHPSVHTERAFGRFADVPELVIWRTLVVNGLTLPATIALGAALATALCVWPKRLFSANRAKWLGPLAILAAMGMEYTSLLHEPRYVYPLLPLMMLPAPMVVSAFRPGRLLAAIAGAFGLYMLCHALLNPVNPYYYWPYIRKQLNEGAELYRLNGNELLQIAPCLNDTAQYHIISRSERIEPGKPVVTRVKLNQSGKPLTGPLRIYR